MHYQYYLLDVFAEQQFGGNQLAVILDSDGLSDAQMQRIAAEFNLSETVFITKANNADAVVGFRIFTPKVELPIAGHPIIGSADVLIREGIVKATEARINFTINVPAGNVPVRVDTHEHQRTIYFGAPVSPEFDSDTPSTENLARVLGLSVNDIDAASVQRVFHGNWTLVIPLKSHQALKNVHHNNALHDDLLGSCAQDQLYPVYVNDDPFSDINIYVRMFFASAGISEDPATGSAAISLSAWLANNDPQFESTYSWTISQGSEINRPSTIKAMAHKENGKITAIRIGGNSVLIAKGELIID